MFNQRLPEPHIATFLVYKANEICLKGVLVKGAWVHEALAK